VALVLAVAELCLVSDASEDENVKERDSGLSSKVAGGYEHMVTPVRK
jgi:hypothetical protein